MTTPNIDTKALRELRDDACKLDGHSLMEVLHAQQKYERAIINAAPALLDLADRAQEQARECASNLRSLRASQEECYSLYEERDALKAERRTFPLQPDRKAKPGPVNIPWSVAEKAYGVYALRFGKDQSIERLAERQGFSWSEMDMFLPGWREECSEIDTLRAKLSASEREAERLRAALTPSGETKAAYSHEFAIRQTWQDENGADCASTTYVPWTTIKDIMHAISKRAALRGEEAPRE